MTDDFEHERDRAVDEARRKARDAEKRARAEAEQLAGEARTDETKEEELRQMGVI